MSNKSSSTSQLLMHSEVPREKGANKYEKKIPWLEPFLIGNGQLGTAGGCRDTGANSKYIWKISAQVRSRQHQMALQLLFLRGDGAVFSMA